MEKQKKSDTNNQWSSLPEEKACKCSNTKKNKTAADNQWTSTLKNNVDDK